MRIVIFSLLILLSTVPCFGQALVLGALEDVPGVYEGEQSWPAVRVLFVHKDQAWSAFPTDCDHPQCLRTIPSKYPSHSEWTIGFDGRAIGRVTSRTPSEYRFYSHIGLQQVENASSVPWVGHKSAQFGGFTGAEVHRPLVANSRPYVADPDGWRRSETPPDIKGSFRNAFRKKYPKLCKTSEADETKLVPYEYRDDAIAIAKAYKSTSGTWIGQIHLPDAIACDDTEAGFGLDDPWFVLERNGTPSYLDEGVWLVDAGDYDNDGRSELLFSIDRDNRGGYVLYYDNFKRHVVFEYSFH